jgi:uncharacterized membrane-anchored protein
LVLVGVFALFELGMGAVLAFWAAYVLTRPFGASLGDFLTAAPHDGGLGLETTGTSELLLVVTLAVVGWFSLQQRRSPARAEVKPLR